MVYGGWRVTDMSVQESILFNTRPQPMRLVNSVFHSVAKLVGWKVSRVISLQEHVWLCTNTYDSDDIAICLQLAIYYSNHEHMYIWCSWPSSCWIATSHQPHHSKDDYGHNTHQNNYNRSPFRRSCVEFLAFLASITSNGVLQRRSAFDTCGGHWWSGCKLVNTH